MHARLNEHYNTTISIAKATLAAELGTWLTAEMDVFVRALGARLTRQVRRVDLLPFTSGSTTVFTRRDWGEFQSSIVRKWVGQTAMKMAMKKALRKGPSDEQAKLLTAIRSKIVKRQMKSVYAKNSKRGKQSMVNS